VRVPLGLAFLALALVACPGQKPTAPPSPADTSATTSAAAPSSGGKTLDEKLLEAYRRHTEKLIRLERSRGNESFARWSEERSHDPVSFHPVDQPFIADAHFFVSMSTDESPVSMGLVPERTPGPVLVVRGDTVFEASSDGKRLVACSIDGPTTVDLTTGILAVLGGDPSVAMLESLGDLLYVLSEGRRLSFVERESQLPDVARAALRGEKVAGCQISYPSTPFVVSPPERTTHPGGVTLKACALSSDDRGGHLERLRIDVETDGFGLERLEGASWGWMRD
jgi:hypothetical protein